jgi:Flp pilus assembly secretin CpaC
LDHYTWEYFYWNNNIDINMKIFLTEINAYGTTFAGPNIIAKTIERAEQAATQNGLVVVGVLDSIYIDDSDSEHMNRVETNEEKIIH